MKESVKPSMPSKKRFARPIRKSRKPTSRPDQAEGSVERMAKGIRSGGDSPAGGRVLHPTAARSRRPIRDAAPGPASCWTELSSGIALVIKTPMLARAASFFRAAYRWRLRDPGDRE